MYNRAFSPPLLPSTSIREFFSFCIIAFSVNEYEWEEGGWSAGNEIKHGLVVP